MVKWKITPEWQVYKMVNGSPSSGSIYSGSVAEGLAATSTILVRITISVTTRLAFEVVIARMTQEIRVSSASRVTYHFSSQATNNWILTFDRHAYSKQYIQI